MGQRVASMCVSPGWGGSRARINTDRCGGCGRGGSGWLHVYGTIEGSIPIIGARIIRRRVVSAGVEPCRDLKHTSATAKFIGGCADDGAVAV
jgi:hypothetical protein